MNLWTGKKKVLAMNRNHTKATSSGAGLRRKKTPHHQYSPHPGTELECSQLASRTPQKGEHSTQCSRCRKSCLEQFKLNHYWGLAVVLHVCTILFRTVITVCSTAIRLVRHWLDSTNMKCSLAHTLQRAQSRRAFLY